MEEETEINQIAVLRESKKGQFGNLFSYYSRKKYDIWNDRRLLSLPKDIFKNKKVLYVGCHEGIVPIQIALKYQPKSIVAIDIDYKLIKKAIHNSILIDRVREMQANEAEKYHFHLACFKDTPFYEGYLNSISDNKLISPLNEIIDFRLQNILQLDKKLEDERFDVICCFALTKYIHLNFGDVGILALFANLAKLIEKNGTLLLQAQTSQSYKKSKSFCHAFSSNFANIKIWPEDFTFVLEDRFKLVLTSTADKKNGNAKKKSSTETLDRKVSIYKFK